MALIGAADRGHAFMKLVLLLIVSLTVVGNAAEFCSWLPAPAECSKRVHALIGLAASSALLCLIALAVRALSLGVGPFLEFVLYVMMLGAWVAAAAICSSYQTTAIAGGDPAILWGSPAFFACWGGALVALSLTLRAFVNADILENMGLKEKATPRAVGAGAGGEGAGAGKPLDASTSGSYAGETAAEYA